MPDWLSIVILGIIEGITEFLPISSTGHLLLVQNNGWIPRQSDLFNTAIQSGAVLAVIVVFAGRVKQMCLEWRQPEVRDYILKLGVAFGITAVGGLLIKAFNWELPETATPVLLAVVIGGVAIIVVEKWLRNRPADESITWAIAIVVGFAQLFAGVFPGTSRSGATILAAMAMGLRRPAATEFSFLLGIPTLIGAGAYETMHALKDGDPGETTWAMVALGSVVSAVTAFLAVKWLLKFVQSHTFIGFGWYRIGLGAVMIVFMFLA